MYDKWLQQVMTSLYIQPALTISKSTFHLFCMIVRVNSDYFLNQH
jgi:hypothetical protein